MTHWEIWANGELIAATAREALVASLYEAAQAVEPAAILWRVSKDEGLAQTDELPGFEFQVRHLRAVKGGKA